MEKTTERPGIRRQLAAMPLANLLTTALFMVTPLAIIGYSTSEPEVYGPDVGRVIGPGLIPTLILLLLAVSSLIEFIRVLWNYTRTAKTELHEKRAGRSRIRTLVLICAWLASCAILIFGLAKVEFTLSVLGFVIGWVLFLGERRVLVIAATSLIGLTVCYILVFLTYAPIATLF